MKNRGGISSNADERLLGNCYHTKKYRNTITRWKRSIMAIITLRLYTKISSLETTMMDSRLLIFWCAFVIHAKVG